MFSVGMKWNVVEIEQTRRELSTASTVVEGKLKGGAKGGNDA